MDIIGSQFPALLEGVVIKSYFIFFTFFNFNELAIQIIHESCKQLRSVCVYWIYLLSTNFNLATPDKGPKDFRYDTGTSMLERLSVSQALAPEYAGEILNTVRLNNITTYTLK